MINIVLFEPEIPANTGNIMRTCVGINAKLHLIKPLGFSLDEKNIKRCAANHINNCEYKVYENYEEFEKSENPKNIYFLTRYGQKNYYDINYPKEENLYFVFGSESKGIDKKLLKENISKTFRIPASDKLRSLNLSNAVAIVGYEAVRQQGFGGLSLKEPIKGENYLNEL